MTQSKSKDLKEIRSIAFELMKESPEQERKINIEDLGDHCTIQISIRVIREEFREAMNQAHARNPQALGEL